MCIFQTKVIKDATCWAIWSDKLWWGVGSVLSLGPIWQYLALFPSSVFMNYSCMCVCICVTKPHWVLEIISDMPPTLHCTISLALVLIIFFFGGGEALLVVLRNFFWLFTQKFLLAALCGNTGCQGSNLVQPHVKQAPYLLCYHSDLVDSLL